MKIPFLLPCLIAATVLGVAGCGKKSETASKETAKAAATIKIGFLVKQPEEPWFQFEWKGAERAAQENHFELIKLGIQDGEKTMSAIDNLAVSGAQGFVICTPDVRLGPTISARAKQKGMKVIAIDDQFVGADGKFLSDAYYLGMSATEIGESVGRQLSKEMHDRNWAVEGTGVCVVTFEELDTARARTDGAMAALKASGFPEGQIFKTPQKTSDIPGSFDAVNVLLTQKPGIKRWLICGMNDNAVLGAVRAMEGRGFTAENTVGIGINGTDCVDELRKKLTGFTGSMFVSAPQEGHDAATMLFNWIDKGIEPAKETHTHGVFIDRKNFEVTLKEAGIIQ